MNNTYHFDTFTDRHAISMEPDKMDQFSEDCSLFATQPAERQHAIADALDSMPNKRYHRLLVGIYREHHSPQYMAEELGVTLPYFYNLHRRALASLKSCLEKQQQPDKGMLTEI